MSLYIFEQVADFLHGFQYCSFPLKLLTTQQTVESQKGSWFIWPPYPARGFLSSVISPTTKFKVYPEKLGLWILFLFKHFIEGSFPNCLITLPSKGLARKHHTFCLRFTTIDKQMTYEFYLIDYFLNWGSFCFEFFHIQRR